MKPSYTQSPRTLSDAVFHTNADPFERDATDKRLTKAIYILATIAAFCFIGVLLAWRG